MTSTRAALEAALAADPDDPARHAAYADLLLEEGDPRGEFVRLQLALEDPELPADRREAMQRAADELPKRHGAEWLGPLQAAIDLGRDVWRDDDGETGRGSPQTTVRWRRGWVDRVRSTDDPRPVWDALRACPAARLIRTVAVWNAGILQNPEALFRSLTGMSIKNISINRIGNGDDVVAGLVRSGLVAQLLDLDLSRCNITDDGALALAACPDVPRLKSLALDGNLISPIGAQALAEVGVRAGSQFWDRGRGDAYV